MLERKSCENCSHDEPMVCNCCYRMSAYNCKKDYREVPEIANNSMVEKIPTINEMQCSIAGLFGLESEETADFFMQCENANYTDIKNLYNSLQKEYEEL